MKRIRIYNSKTAAPETKKSLRAAALSYINSLFPRKRKYDIFINLKRNLIRDEECYGYMESLSTKSFVITLDSSLPIDTLLETLAHEMVHVKQWFRGELAEPKPGVFKWHGEPVDVDQINYTNLPWEREAEELQSIIFDKYKYDNIS
jgi:hypothetical protein